MTDFELQELQTRRQRAQELRQTDMPQGRMVGRIYVNANPLEYLAAGLRRRAGTAQDKTIGEEMTALQGKREGMDQAAIAKFTSALRGEPARDIAPLTPMDDEGNQMPVARKEAVAPDAMAGYSALMGAYNPQLRQTGMQGLVTTQQEAAKRAQTEALNAKYGQIMKSGATPQQAIAMGVPVDFVKAYSESPNYGRAKVQFKDVGGQLVPVTEYGETPQGIGRIDKTGNPFSDPLIRDASGNMVPNAPLVGVKEKIAKAGKTSVTVNMPDKKFYEGLGTAISENIGNAYTQAQSAASTLNNANQIAAAIPKAIVGPLANQRLTMTQIGQTLGVTGADATEVLQNTRNLMQGLARQELAAAGQMKGQGQITESERQILRKAEAGQINEMTKPELEAFVSAIRKTARARLATHQSNLEKLSKDPQAANIVKFMNIEAPADVGGQNQVQQLLDKYK